MAVEFTPEAEQEFQKVVACYEHPRAALLPVLHLAQRLYGCITPEVEEYIARRLDVPLTKVHEVVTFYTLYRKNTTGRHIIRICHSLTCHLLGANVIHQHICKKVGLKDGEDTTQDGRFTVESVECMGACEMAPMIQVDERYFGPLSPEDVDALIDNLTDEPLIEEVEEEE